MQLLSRLVTPFLLVSLLAACQSTGVRPAGSVAPAGEPDAVLRISATEPAAERASGLTSDIVFSLLAGEVAAQRGALPEAYRYQYQSALLASDAKSAERATRLALHMEEPELALKAARLWVELAPNELAARQLVVVLLLRQDQKAPVLEHLKAIVEISEAQQENGFLAAMSAINRELKAQDALALMQQLVAEYPDDPHGRYALVVTALVEKDYPTAEQEAARLVSEHPHWPNGFVLQSRVQVVQGNKERAREILALAVSRFPDDETVISTYARLLIENKQLQQAYEQFLRLEQMGRVDGDTYYWLGLLALELDHHGEAREYFLQLIDLGKRTDVAAYYLGRIAEEASESRQAIEWYQKVKTGEHSDEAQVRIVRLMAAAGQIEEARDWIQRIRIQYPTRSAQLYLVEAELLREHGTSEQVMTLFDDALDALPGNSELLYSRGLYAASLNRVDILERDLLQVIASDPGHADALNALGYTLADQTDRHQEALDYIQRALKLKPDSAAILDSMGWVLYRLGRHQEAIGYLQQAYAKLPDPEIAAHLGEVLWVSGDRQQAREIWQRVLEQTPESRHVLEVMRRLNI
ncbi:MAG: tetratricopeptide repeat protein [Sedimenticola sp.]|nr:tetratricopeptide repeat protein [Sedimenticola sp.]